VDTQLPPLFVTVNETKRLLCVGHSHIYKMMNAGQIKRVKNGGKTLVPYQSIVDYAASLQEAAR